MTNCLLDSNNFKCVRANHTRSLMTIKRETFPGLPFQLDFLLNFTKMMYMQYYISILPCLEFVVFERIVFVLLCHAETIVLLVS